MSVPRVGAHSSLAARVRALVSFRGAFTLGILLKGLDGLGELLVAAALLVVTPQQIRGLVSLATRGELSEDPHDFTANLLLRATAHLSSGTTTFLMAYLVVHAVVKLVSVYGILANHRWAYPFALVALGLLTLYQLVDIALKPSVGVILLTILDVIIIWLIWREFSRIRSGEDPQMIERRRS